MINPICNKCGCGCIIVSFECIKKHAPKLGDYGKIDHKYDILDLVNDEVLIDQVLGYECFNELCKDIKSAKSKADEYNSQNVGSNLGYKPFVSDKWRVLIENDLFQKMYARYFSYYLYHVGHASSTMKNEGDVRSTRASGTNEGTAHSNISLKDAENQAAKYLALAQRSKDRFNKYVWNKIKDQFNCFPKEDNCCPSQKEIGVRFVGTRIC